MYLLDDDNRTLDAEFSLDLIDSEHCIVVESSGGASPRRGIKRRNPEYNALLNIIFARLAHSRIRITRVILDSEKVTTLPVSKRVATLDMPYPVDLIGVDVEEFRKMVGRKIAAMHRDPEATQGGNAQKRIRICLEASVTPSQLVVGPGKALLADFPQDCSPSLDETERECLRAARLGQGMFRQSLLARYGDICPITDIVNPELLVASHIKPWSVCSNAERLDPDNGILLSAMADKLFDRGLITFNDNGSILVSSRLSSSDRSRCGLDEARRLLFSQETQRYLAYHRQLIFKST